MTTSSRFEWRGEARGLWRDSASAQRQFGNRIAGASIRLGAAFDTGLVIISRPN